MQDTTFYLVRHGQTEYNRKRIVQGRGVNSDLNETGRRQAAALGERLREVPFTVAYTSPLRRAVQTTEAILQHHEGLPTFQMEDLEEMSWGRYEGSAATSDLLEAFDVLKAEWAEGRYDRPIDGGESILDVQRRALRAIEHMNERHQGETVLIVTHGRFLRVLLATLLEEYGLARMQDIKHANTAVNKVVLQAGCYEARLLNCTAHLDNLETIAVQ
jgi:broad specificity phosphatase PhoE